MKNIFILVSQHRIIAAAVLVLAVLIGWQLSHSKGKPLYDTATVTTGDVVQEVSVTGKVESEHSIDLAFDRSGKVSAPPKPVGALVPFGAALVRLDVSELSALRLQAQANADYEAARLEELQKGSRAEEIAVTEAQRFAATRALGDATVAFVDKLALANDALEDAIYAKTDALFDAPRTNQLRLTVPVTDLSLVSSLEERRVAIGNALRSVNTADPDGYLADIKNALTLTRTYLDDLLIGVSSVTPSSSYGQAAIDAAKSNVISARSGVSSAQTALLAAEEKYTAAHQAAAIAEEQLTLKKAPATPEAIAAQEARLRATKATVANYDAQISKMTIVAPFPGIVTKQNAKLGQNVAPNVPMVTLQSSGLFKIVTNIPEVDVAKVTIGDTARITLDAYGPDTVFSATVREIDPAETIIENVPTYKITLYFDGKDERVRTGMTANIDILTEQRGGVLRIPARAVTVADGKKTVQVVEGNLARVVAVETGLRGSDGQIEVVSGLTAGQQVVTFEKAK